MAIIAFDTPILDLDNKLVYIDRGDDICATSNGHNTPLRLRDICLSALMSQIPGDENLPPAQRFDLFELALRIHKSDSLEISSEEILVLKQRICKTHTLLAAGRAMEILEGMNGAKDTKR